MPESLAELQTNAIAYEKIGCGPPILFIHGLTYDRRMWDPLVTRLAGDFTCFSVDLPGHGESDDARNYDLLAVVRSVHQTFCRLESRAPVVVGHSIGAVHSTAYAAIYPVAGLVTSDQTLRSLPFLERLERMRDALRGAAFPTIWRAIESDPGVGLIPEPQRALVESASSPRQDVVLGYWREVFDDGPAVLQALLEKFAANVDVPFSAVFGDDVEPDYRAWLQPFVPQCNVVVFPHSGHFPHLVEIDLFAEEIRAVAKAVRAVAKAGRLKLA
jgi:pimeloyl-ACP methyl ester carboxylesterase